jgi:hypothetical protein
MAVDAVVLHVHIRPPPTQPTNTLCSACGGAVTEINKFGLTYKHYSGLHNFEQAQDRCAAAGMVLTTVNSPQQAAALQAEVAKYQGSDNFWIGGFNNGSWYWDDATTFGYTNWAGTAPTGEAGKCISVAASDNSGGEWTAAACTATKAFLCSPLGEGGGEH